MSRRLRLRKAVQAGASVIHLHVREDDGRPSQSEWSVSKSRSARSARARPGVIIQISTGGAVGESFENRAHALALKPEMASLNLGTMNFGEEIFYNHPRDIVALAQSMRTLGIVPELEIYEAGMLESALRMAHQGVLREPLHFQFVLGVPGGMSGDLRNLLHLHSLLPREA